MTHLYDAHFQAEDENGEPLAGALLYFYVTGTTTPITVYQDAGKAVSHTNPVVADSAGRFAPIWVDTNGYKTILKTSGGTTVQTTDTIYRGPGWSSSGYLTGPGVINTAADSETIIAGGLSSTTGGRLRLYGPSHATQASDITFFTGTSAVYQYDHDQNLQDWYAPANTRALRLTSTTLQPGSNDLLSLGSTSAGFADLYGATGFTWNIGNGNVVWTHSSGIMTLGTGELRITTVGTNAASVPTLGSTSTVQNKTNQAASGTVSAPSYSFASNTDMGFFREASVAERIAITVDNAQVGYFNDSGLTVIASTPAATFGSVAAAKLILGGQIDVTRDNGAGIRISRFNGDGAVLSVHSGSTQVGSISFSGSTTAYNTSSDERLKQDFVDFDSASIVDAVQVYDFAWKDSDQRSFGSKAQELHKVFPQAVTPGHGEPGDEDFEPWSIDYSKLVPVLMREVQSLRERVAALEAKL